VVLLAGGTGRNTSGTDAETRGETADGTAGETAAGGVAVVAPPKVKAKRSLRPYAVIGGLVASFSLFTLFGTLLVSALGLPADLLKIVGVTLLILIGLGLLFPRVDRILERPFARLPLWSVKSQRSANSDRGGFVLGLGLGLLYVPCAGPVLTAITVAGATNKVTFNTVVITLAFSIGATLPLLVFALAGQRIGQRLAAFRRRQRLIRSASGVLMILLALALAFNLAEVLQRAIPDYTAGLQKSVAADPALKPKLSTLNSDGNKLLARCEDSAPDLRECGPAPELDNVTAWLNTPGNAPLRMSALRGRVVLIDFWTYSCINCQRSLPHVDAWDDAYRNAGLTVIGVHTPEFAFERDLANVRAGADRLGVHHPIAVDNGYSMFTAYRNQYWPAQFLVDASGQVRYFKLGEGNYDVTERHIRELLTAAHPGTVLPAPTEVPDQTVTDPRTSPETYLNAGQIKGYVGDPLDLTAPKAYHFPADMPVNTVSLDGNWKVGFQYFTAGQNARLAMHFSARKVYLVVAGEGTLTTDLDGADRRTIAITGPPMLYPLVQGDSLREGRLTVGLTPGLSAYVFTFG
jgi:cytochrome c biogenesis protein CcdA/thiol-disulfide isomerase/thioredoxin